jgi:hypothetical protein
VKERRALPEPSAAGACSASCEGVGDMAGVSGGHFAVGEGEGAGEGAGESEGVTEGGAESEAGPQSSSWASSAKGGSSLGSKVPCLAFAAERLGNGQADRRTGGQADKFHHKQRRRLGCHNPQLAMAREAMHPK